MSKPQRKGKIQANYDRMMASRRKITACFRRWCLEKQPYQADKPIADIYINESKDVVFTMESRQVIRIPITELEEY